MSKEMWSALKRTFERIYLGITGKTTKIIDIPPSEDALGYTSKDGKIHLAASHPMMGALTESQKNTFLLGVFCHETLHQVFTNFYYLETKMAKFKKRSSFERWVYAQISNIVEDAGIEYFAPSVVGGSTLKALRFTIAHTYKSSPKLEKSTDAFSQYMNALIQFGNMGVLKGKFTFPEAKTCFAKTAPLFNKAILEPDSCKRMDYSEEILDISRPLWEEQAKEAEKEEEMMKALADLLEEMGKSGMSGTGSGSVAEDPADEGGKAAKRRKITIKKVTKEEMEEIERNSSESSGDSGGDITVLVCDEKNEEKEEEKNASSSLPIPSDKEEENEEESTPSSAPGSGSKSEGKSQNEKSSDSSSGEAEDENEDKEESSCSDNCGDKNSDDDNVSDDNTSSNGSSSNSDADSPADTSEDSKGDASDKETKSSASNSSFRDTHLDGADSKHTGAEGDEDEEENAEISNDEFEIDEEVLREINDKIKRMCEEEKESAAMDDSPIPDFDTSSVRMKKRSTKNYRVVTNGFHAEALIDAYNTNLVRLSPGINTTTQALKRILRDDQEETLFTNSGKISLKRMSGEVRENIFTRKKAPSNKSDLALFVLVDESGSMGSSRKYAHAMDCCISLAEICDKLDIPIYVMGFTADTDGYDVVHAHYITWKNTKSDRAKLLNIAARANNCDGASIRYATEAIKKKQATHKLLVVISDGQPAARNYADGMADTRDAVRAAKKHCSVLGVAIGNCNAEAIQHIYEKDFMYVPQVDTLFSSLCKKLKPIIKKW